MNRPSDATRTAAYAAKLRQVVSVKARAWSRKVHATFSSIDCAKAAQAIAAARLGPRLSLIGCVVDVDYGHIFRAKFDPVNVDIRHLLTMAG